MSDHPGEPGSVGAMTVSKSMWGTRTGRARRRWPGPLDPADDHGPGHACALGALPAEQLALDEHGDHLGAFDRVLGDVLADRTAAENDDGCDEVGSARTEAQEACLPLQRSNTTAPYDVRHSCAIILHPPPGRSRAL